MSLQIPADLEGSRIFSDHLQGTSDKEGVVRSSSSAPVSSFPCGECGGAFRSVQGLKHHQVRTHGREGKYSCGVCGLNFRRVDEMRRHSLNVHGKDERLKCDLCERSYMLAGDLNRHKKIAHRGK